MPSPYAPLEMPNFQKGASVDGDPLATMNDLAELRSFLLSLVGTRVQELVFNNGAVFIGGSSGTGALPTVLSDKITQKIKGIHHAYAGDAALGTSFTIFQSQADADAFKFADNTPVITDYGLVTQAAPTIRQASLTTESVKVRQLLLVHASSFITFSDYQYIEFQLKPTLNADNLTYSVKLDYRRWASNPAGNPPGLPLFSQMFNQLWVADYHAIPLVPADVALLDQTNLDQVMVDLLFAQAGITPAPVREKLPLGFSVGYCAFAVK